MEYEHSNEYLIHRGIKGQKWGLRRYRNYDGTLTPEGKERYQKNPDGSPKRKPISVNSASVRSTAEGVKKITDSASKVVSKIPNKNTGEDVSKMSDEDLRRIVNRLNLERRYTELTGSGEVGKGKRIALEVLDTIGEIAIATGAVAGLLAAVKKV